MRRLVVMMLVVISISCVNPQQRPYYDTGPVATVRESDSANSWASWPMAAIATILTLTILAQNFRRNGNSK